MRCSIHTLRLPLVAALMLNVALHAADNTKFNPLGLPKQSSETNKGWEFLYDGDLEKAAVSFTKASSKSAGDSAAWYGLALNASAENDFQKSLECLCKAVLTGGSSPWIECYLEEIDDTLPYCRDLKPFIDLAKQALESNSLRPHHKDVLRRVYGHCLIQQGKISEAEDVLKPLGYITNWMLTGPIDNRDKAGFPQSYEPESGVDFEKSIPGRGRRISWFRSQVAPIDGSITLSELFEPRTHVLAYAVTYVKTDAARWAVLRAGCAGACAVFVNDQKVASVDNYNDFGDDKISVPVYLQSGWNQILIKTGVVEETEWAFSLRLCEPAGGALSGLTFDTSNEALTAYNAAKKTRPAAPAQPDTAFELGLQKALEDALKSQPANVSLLSTYGLLIDQRNLDEKENRSAAKSIARAIELAPKCPLLKLRLATVSEDTNEARQAAESLLQSHPGLPATYDVLANIAEESHLHLIAGDYVRQARAKFGAQKVGASALVLAGDPPPSPSPQTRAPRSRRNRTALLPQQIEANHAQGWRVASELVERFPYYPEGWLRLIELEDTDSAKRACVQKAISYCGGNLRLRQEWANQLVAIGKDRDAAEFLENGLKLQPFSMSAHISISRQWQHAGDVARAIRVLEDAKKIAPESPEILDALAQLYHHENRDADAVALFKEIIRLKPNSPQVKDYLSQLDSKPSADQQFYAAYDVKLSDLKFPDASAYPNDNVINVLNQEVLHVNSNGSSSRMIHRVCKLLRPNGIAELSHHEIYYDPSRQVVDMIKAAVITPDGRELSRATVQDRSTSAAMGVQTKIYDEHHLKQVIFNDLQPGAVVDLQYTIRDSGDNIYGDFFADTFYLGDDSPTIKSQYILDFPKNLNLQTRTFNCKVQAQRVPSNDAQREVMKWELENQSGILQERGMPPVIDQLAQLQVTTMGSWQEVGNWYYNLAKDSLVCSDEMRKLVTDITKDCKTDTEKLRVVHDWVIAKIRYLGIEFGRNGYKPHKASESFKALYGDCKDTATLITSMLSAINIDSKLVLIRTVNAGAVPPDSLPMPNLFNHCIAYVPNCDGKDYWIDCTTDYHKLGEVPAADQTAQVIVIGAEGGKFMKIPGGTPQENMIEQQFMVHLDKNGAAAVQIRDQRHGQFAPAYRELAETPGRYERYMKDYAAKRFNGAELAKLEVSQVNEQGPAWMKAELKIPTLAARSGERQVLPSSFDALYLSPRYAAETRRNHDLEFFFPWARKCQLVYDLDKNTKVAALPEQCDINEAFGKFSRKIKQEGEKLIIDEYLELSRQRIFVKDYEAFKVFCNKVDSMMEQKVLLDSK